LKHTCGVWAVKDPAFAKRVAAMVPEVGFDSSAWGQVSLWGRVIEHERGYRAQYAYPYAITVQSLDERVARVIRDGYAVDVEWQAPPPLPEQRDKEWQKQREEEQARIAALPPLPSLDDLTMDEILVGLLTAIAKERDRCRGHWFDKSPLDRAMAVSPTDVTAGARPNLAHRASRTGAARAGRLAETDHCFWLSGSPVTWGRKRISRRALLDELVCTSSARRAEARRIGMRADRSDG
jgi:hypothetical protein